MDPIENNGDWILDDDTSKEAFVKRYLPAAQKAEAVTGVPAHYALGQAALESGWGDHAPGHNFFGIKGNGQTLDTHEFKDGRMVRKQQSFRSYADPTEAFIDYGKLMSSPRYKKAAAASTPEDFARGVHKAGYATDPQYSSKLGKTIGSVMSALGIGTAQADETAPSGNGVMREAIANNGDWVLDEAPHGAIQNNGDWVQDDAQVVPDAQPAAHDPTEGMSPSELRMAGLGKSIVDTGRGAGQILRHVLPDSLSDSIGLPTQADIDEARRLDKPLMNTTWGKVGNAAGQIGMTFAPGGIVKAAGALSKAPALVKAGSALLNPQTVRQGMALGAVTGALQPTASDDSAAGQIAAGAVGGGLGAAVPNALARVVRPQTREAAQKLIDEGVNPTAGQILGGTAQRLEDAATSIPFVGDAVRGAQRRAMQDFNRAAINRALKPIGEKLPSNVPVGNEAVKYMGDRLSNAYNDLLPQLKIHVDDTFTGELDSLKQLAQDLPAERGAQLERYIQNNVLGRFTAEGNMLGETMKHVDEKLGKDISRYSHSLDPDQQVYGDALKETQAILRRLVERLNPEHAERLGAINEGWANLVRVEKAGSMLGAKEGVFSGANLRNAVKSSDPRVRHRGFARGEALMQDLADVGENVLGQKVPDSGTPFRLGAMAPVGASYLLSPDLAFGALGAAGAYSPAGQKLAQWALTRRPQAATTLANLLRRTATPLSIGGAALSPNFAKQ